ncbi:MAG TPA: molybdopterin-dependent oxidoreductase [Polyangiales bacterium]|nr:molybdopterin-dependent oxidoreductase [Polyangiales bacterium]
MADLPPTHTQHRTVCNRDCPDTCSIVATVEAGRVTALRGDPDHPVTRGALCYRTNHFLTTQYSPERLMQPLLRKSGELTPVSWDEALDFVAEGLERTKRESGAASIVHYRSAGSLGLLKHLSDYFFSLFGPVTVKRGDICSGAGEAAQLIDFGESDSNDIFTLLESKHILVWGKNLVTSSPHTLRVVREARQRGAKVVLIDPVSHPTVRHVDHYLQPQPGGDFPLAMAVARLCFEHGFVDPRAREYCDGLAEFRALAERESVEAWCKLADVTPEQAMLVARALGQGPTAIIVGWGMARRTDGGAIVRALDALGAITGNVGIPGGGVSYYFRRRGAFDLSFTQPNPAPRTVCEPTLARDIEALRDPPARALWITAGNPVVMLPDSETTVRVIREMPLSVVVDSFLTDTARIATVVLPTTTLLEADDILGSYGHHYLGVSQPVVAAPSSVKSDLEIIQALAQRVGLGAQLAGTHRDWKQRLVATKLKAHGVDLETIERGNFKNPLAQPVVFEGQKFATPNGKANLMREAPPLASRPSAQYPLFLLSMSTPKSQCSQWATTPELPLPLTVHPSAAGGCADGEICEIESVLGRIPVRIEHDPDQRLDIALLPKGGPRSASACGNMLIRARTTDLGEGGALYEECVRIVPRATRDLGPEPGSDEPARPADER